MNITQETIVGELVAEDYRTASVLKSYNIDFCCKGNVSIQHACELNAVDTDKVIQELVKASAAGDDNTPDYQSWPLDKLIDHIEQKHHKYVEAKIPELKAYLKRICHVHGSHNPELYEIDALFEEGAGELTAHMKKEEFLLFPFIRKMVAAKASGGSATTSLFSSVKSPVQAMKQEHEAEGDRYVKISQLSNQYTPPASACNTYTVAYALLKEFEDDLHMHIHLENNILFPQAIELEKEFTDPSAE